MDLSIIIVNWNVRDLLEKCLASIYRETRNIDFEVIVVDNASNDGSALMIKTKFPKVRLIENKKNKWFAGGNNQGFKIAKGELILLLNPDTEILDEAIEKMAGIMRNGINPASSAGQELRIKNNSGNKLEIRNWKFQTEACLRRQADQPLAERNKEIVEKIPRDPPFDKLRAGSLEKGETSNIGVLGCKLLNSDMSLQPSCRRLPCLFDQIFILLKLHNFFPLLKHVRAYYMSDFDYNLQDKNSNIGRVKPARLNSRSGGGPDLPRVEQGPLTLPMRAREVEQVMGACLMTRKEIIDKIGGLDEEYGAHFEEVDFCKRVVDLGWKIYFTPQAQIIHHKGQSFRQRKIITNQKNFNLALLRYFRKYKPFWQYLIILALWPVSMFLAIADQIMIIAGIHSFKSRFKKKNY